MANPHRGEFEVKLNGSVYKGRLGLDELTEFQELFRPPGGFAPRISELYAQVQAEQLKYIRALIWAGLRAYQPELQLSDVAALVNASDPKDVQVALGTLGVRLQPAPEDVRALGVDARPTAAAPVEEPGRQTRKRATKKSEATTSRDALPA